MKMMIVQIVFVAFVCSTMAGTGVDAENLVKPAAEQDLYSREALLANLNKVELHTLTFRQVPVSEYVAKLLYETKDKLNTEVLNHVTVAQMIKQNTIRVADCNLLAFKERTTMLQSLRPADIQQFKKSPAVFAVNVFALRCLHLAADYCLRNEKDVITGRASDAKFMAGLKVAQMQDYQSPETNEMWDESHIYNNYKSKVQEYIEGYGTGPF